jgi:hypothetical protein
MWTWSISAEYRDDGSCCGMTRDSAGPDGRILAMRVRPLAGGCRPTLSPAALPVAEQSSRAGAVTGVGVQRQSRRLDRAGLTLVLWNANSHADRHGRGCRSAPAMQQSGGSDLTTASTVSQELLSSKHQSSSLAEPARTAA